MLCARGDSLGESGNYERAGAWGRGKIRQLLLLADTTILILKEPAQAGK